MTVTPTMNPAINISTSVSQVIAEKKLRCITTCYEPEGGGINVSRAIKSLGGESLAIFTSGGSTGQMLEKILEHDSVIAGIALYLSLGKSLYESVRYGVAAEAAAIMTPGKVLFSREDTEFLYERGIVEKT